MLAESVIAEQLSKRPSTAFVTNVVAVPQGSCICLYTQGSVLQVSSRGKRETLKCVKMSDADRYTPDIPKDTGDHARLFSVP